MHPSPDVSRLPCATRTEQDASRPLSADLAMLDWSTVIAQARSWSQALRKRTAPSPFRAVTLLSQEHGLSRAEGWALVRLAEGLLRLPDSRTALPLAAEFLEQARSGEQPVGTGAQASPPARAWSRLSELAQAWSTDLPSAQAAATLWQRLGIPTMMNALLHCAELLGQQFILGSDIDTALQAAVRLRADAPTLRFTFELLGDNARTEAQAQRHFRACLAAVQALRQDDDPSSVDPEAVRDDADTVSRRQPHATKGGAPAVPATAHGLCVQLSRLHQRLEESQRQQVLAHLVPRVWQLVEAAAQARIQLCLGAEDGERLELLLDVFEALCQRVARHAPTWDGFGLTVQADQTRAVATVHEIARIAREHQLRCRVLLTEGTQGDREVRRAHTLGLPGCAVFTEPKHAALSYLACAQALLGHAPRLFPQFATHDLRTLAAVSQLVQRQAAGQAHDAVEMQRLHGMGEDLYREVARDPALRTRMPVRVHAPVGLGDDLPAWLSRLRLEDRESIDPASLAAYPSPWDADARSMSARVPVSVPQRDQHAPGRPSAPGLDLAAAEDRQRLRRALQALHAESERQAPAVTRATTHDIDAAMPALQAAQEAWDETTPARRAAVLRLAAQNLETRLPAFCALLVTEAQKTWSDALAEVRTAVDLLRHHATQAVQLLVPRAVSGPWSEHRESRLRGRGVFVCISPWSAPLSVFLGQVAAALVGGNSVAAKPAEQTPRIAARAVSLLHEAGVPPAALRLFHGAGDDIGAALVADRRTAGVCFTGTSGVARSIRHQLALREDGALVPLVATTGGVNAMLVDSTAAPGGVVDAVVRSAFRSAGQRCTALRLLCVHHAVADAVIDMLRGALHALRLGDPRAFDTDLGPLIDAEATDTVLSHVDHLRRTAVLIAEGHPADDPRFGFDQSPALVPPIAFEVQRIGAVQEEVFGPVLQVVRWGSRDQAGEAEIEDGLAVIKQIDTLGASLALGIHTRFDQRARRWARASNVDNVYINRDMQGALGGGADDGPHGLLRFCVAQTLVSRW